VGLLLYHVRGQRVAAGGCGTGAASCSVPRRRRYAATGSVGGWV